MPVGSHLKRASRGFLIIAVAVVSLLAVTEADAQQLYIKVGDTTGYYGQTNSIITVYLDNYEQEVGAFTLWLRLGRTDLAKFQTEIDTVVDTTYWHCTDGVTGACNDAEAYVEELHGAWDPNFDYIVVQTIEAPIGNLDLSGTLIENWEFVETRNIDEDGNDIRVSALANVTGDGHFTPGIAPQTGGILFRLRADILPEPFEPDPLPRAELQIIDDAKQYFVFSRPDGIAIGYDQVEIPDTNYFKCLQWDGEDCINWQPTQQCNPCDSTEYTTATIAVLNPDSVLYFDGSVTALIKPYLCGNVDNDPGDVIDLTDVLVAASYAFLGGDPPPILEAANADCSPNGTIDLTDILIIAAYAFLGGPAPCSEQFNGGC